MAVKKSRRRTVAKRPVAKKRAARRPVRRTTKAAFFRTPAGHVTTPSGLIIPERAAVVSSSKLKAGLASAQKQISRFIQDVVDDLQGDYTIKEIELTAAFDVDGKFMGFGVGGATSVKIRVAPEKE